MGAGVIVGGGFSGTGTCEYWGVDGLEVAGSCCVQGFLCDHFIGGGWE